jgi:hypothetical protein
MNQMRVMTKFASKITPRKEDGAAKMTRIVYG